MVVGDIAEGLVYALPPEIASKLGLLIGILQALGIFVII